MKRLAVFGCLLLGGVAFEGNALAAPLDPAHPPREATASEIKDGDAAAAEFEKANAAKLLDPKSSPEAKALIDKLNAMAKKLGAISGRPGINYVVKVVENPDINAFTLPNGKIYVYRGLLNYAASDDEIAGVMAHEIGHNTRLHALRGQSKAKKLNWAALAMMAAMLAGGTSGANVAQFSQYMLLGVMNGYGVGYEKEADAEGIELMEKAGYNPSGMVTFMQRLNLQEKRAPEVKLGIFQTHPPSEERAEAALAQLKREGIPFTPREVMSDEGVAAKETADRWTISMGTVTLFELAKGGAASAKKDAERAQTLKTRVDSLLRSGVKAYEMSASPDGKLIARGQVVAQVTAADAALAKETPDKLAKSWLAGFQRLFWREQINGKW
jgi:beta-barrel assembly-enhancing protease